MVTHSSYRAVNPNLGTSFATFASIIAGSAILFAIFEQLGIDAVWLGHLLIGLPVMAYFAIGVYSRTVMVDEFFVSGRRVPAFYSGLALAASALGGAGFFALTGAVFLIGYDALAVLLGLGGGFVLMAILFAPYIRKFGSYTLPGFLGERHDSTAVRMVAVVLAIIPAVPVLAAELKMAALVAAQFTSMNYDTLVLVGAFSVLTSVILGGMRGLTWTQSAQYIVVLFGFLTPLFILAVMHTNLPLPQLTYGSLLADIARAESTGGIVPTTPTSIAQALPFDQAEAMLKPFAQAFGAISWPDYILLMVCIMLGIASMPALLMRTGTARSVIDMRRASGWGMFLFGLMLISIPAYAVFAKYLTLQTLIGQPFAQLPSWFEDLRQSGLVRAHDGDGNGVLGLRELLVSRDAMVLMLPIIGGLPFVLVGLLAAAGLSAALAAAGAQTIAVANAVGGDLFHGLKYRAVSGSKRLLVSRLAVILVLALAGAIALTQDFDILRMVIWSLSLVGAGTRSPLRLPMRLAGICFTA